jgi:AraC-like DNA-binding protein
MLLPSHITPQIEEITRTFTREDRGFNMHLHEVQMADLKVLWANYDAEEIRTHSMAIRRENVEMHFRLRGRSDAKYPGTNNMAMYSNQHSLFYRQSNLDAQYTMFPGQENAFFEIEFSRAYFEALITQESTFLSHFSSQIRPEVTSLWPGFALSITPQMNMVITEMINTTYTGHMKRLFMEAKTIELFLLQVSGFEQHQQSATLLPQFRPHDLDCLHAAKAYLDLNYGDQCSIMTLATQVGINQKKLKQGFKALFGHTVFGYLSHVRMEMAKQLLLDEKKTISEVSAIVGYQHPQHFTAAFKRKYGVLPSCVRD